MMIMMCNIETWTLFVFHFEISGSDNNEEHPLNIPHMSTTFEVFHFEISDNNFSDEQLKNIHFISVTLLVFHLEISGNDDIFVH